MGRNSGAGSGRGAGARAIGPSLGTRFVTGAELAGVRINGQPLVGTSETRLESIRQMFRAGKAGQNKVKVAVNRDGSLEIIDGRHRIIVAQEPEFKDVRLRTTFSRGSGGRRR